jgi:membrane protein implicated in regulation of membrane protease activity
MSSLLANMDWWHWLVFGLVLAALEAFVPGAVAIWFGASAAFIGLLLVVLPIPWQLQWIGFAIGGIVAVYLYKVYERRNPDKDEQPNLNRGGTQFIGSEFVLIEAIEQGSGKARVGDGVWKVAGPELPAGARVKVTGVDGTVLQVVPA